MSVKYRCPTCSSTQKKHDEVACEEYEAWLDEQEPPEDESA